MMAVDMVSPDELEQQFVATVERYRETVHSLLSIARQAVEHHDLNIKKIAFPPMPPQGSS